MTSDLDPRKHDRKQSGSKDQLFGPAHLDPEWASSLAVAPLPGDGPLCAEEFPSTLLGRW